MRAVANLSFMFKEAGPNVASRCMAAAEAGFTAVESDWPGETLPAERYRDALKEARLTPALINCYQGTDGCLLVIH